MQKTIDLNTIETILKHFNIQENIKNLKMYDHTIEDDGWLKIICRITTSSDKMLIVKILHEDKDLSEEMQKIERQSVFSEKMRSHGIKTPMRYMADGKYVLPFTYQSIPCAVTVEEWCGEEITEITTDIAYKIGELMARMHKISLEAEFKIGCGTLFCAAYRNDVDIFPKFLKITKDDRLDQSVVTQIIGCHDEKLKRIRESWDLLPKAAVQGDISINNLVLTGSELTVFDYNNAGDEVLVSDLVLEGLLTAYEMDLPEGTQDEYREKLFPAFLKGYLFVRPLSKIESEVAWEIYTMYHSLWFSRVVYKTGSLEELIKAGNYDSANLLLKTILADMTKTDDGRFNAC